MPPNFVAEPSVHLSGLAVSSFLDGLLPALARLDARLEEAVQMAQARFGADATDDLYRGLYVSAEEVERLWAQPPLTPHFSANGSGEDPLAGIAVEAIQGRLHWLQSRYQLTAFDLDLLLLALAPELDRRYERIYAYLQDHVSRRWPTVDLALHLFCTNAVERIERRIHFDPDAALVKAGLLHLIPEQETTAPSLLSHTLRLDEQVVRFLLHQDSPDSRIAPYCRLHLPTGAQPHPSSHPDQRAQLTAVLTQAWRRAQPLRLYLQGLAGVGKGQTLLAAAETISAPVLLVALNAITGKRSEIQATLQLLFRYATFYRCILSLDGLHHWQADDRAVALPDLEQALADHAGIVVLAGSQPWRGGTQALLGMLTLSFALPAFAQRRDDWQQQLYRDGMALESAALTALADRFRLTPRQITEAAALAQTLAQARTENGTSGEDDWDTTPTVDDYFVAACAQSSHDLATLAHKVTLHYQWSDIVLPDDARMQLQEICQRVAQRYLVLEAWGFEQKLSSGKGVNVLFAGPSGAGKTMAAEIIANELGLDLYKIDLSGVVSKYIGETEKNLDRIFSAAENANAILFFDEADALFGKRSEVSDAHDRYANIEISYLLQKMEEFDGVTILATNLRQNLDDAFLRRLAFAVHFPFPDEPSRLQIWQSIWPQATPLAADVDLPWLAERFKVAGGNIKNIALAAAFLAATETSPVTMRHLLQATRREYQKLGKPLNLSELGPYAQEMAS